MILISCVKREESSKRLKAQNCCFFSHISNSKGIFCTSDPATSQTLTDVCRQGDLSLCYSCDSSLNEDNQDHLMTVFYIRSALFQARSELG